ncbi:SNF2 family N-terminal domain-containing protein [Gongronella butleri]|nr:SNF2 family N-terminal domain-containing protein [Gongronella butleri]
MIARTNVDSTRYWIHIHDDEDLSALVTRLCTLYPDEWQSEITYKVYVDVGGVYYGVESAFWLRDRDHILVTTIDDVSKIPDIDWNSVGARLRPEISLLHYQEEGVKRLISMEQQHGGGILADEMGLGKTLQMLSLVIRQQPKLNISAKTLIIVPSMGVADHWAHEIRTKTTEGSLPYTVYRPENLSMVEQNIFKVVITTYDRIRSEYAKQGTGHNMSFFFTTKWFRVVLDESNKLRNLRTKLAHAIQSLDTRYRWCISGTPFQNNLNELVPVFDFLRVRYDKTQAHDPEYTRILLSMYMLRRCKKDVQNDLAIKPRQEERVILEFSEPERALYDYLERILYKQLRFQDDPESDSCLASSLLYLRLKQACAHHMMLIDRFPHLIPMAQKESDEAIREMMNANAMVHKGRTDDAELAEICDIIKDFYDQCDDEESSPNVEEMQKLPHITHSTKVKWLVKFLRDTLAKSKEEKVVVVSQFVDFLEIISKVLSQQDIIHGTYNGSMNTTQRRNAFDLFVASPTNRVLLLSLKAGGVGLNLQCANHMVILDRWWNPATMGKQRVHTYWANRGKKTHPDASHFFFFFVKTQKKKKYRSSCVAHPSHESEQANIHPYGDHQGHRRGNTAGHGAEEKGEAVCTKKTCK